MTKSKIQITSQVVAQGSYGLYKINRRNGVRIGNVITVWHRYVDGQPDGTYLTREEARRGAGREYVGGPE